MTHICISKIIIFGSNNGLSCGRRQAFTWTNTDLFSIGHLGKNINEILIVIQAFFNSRKCIWKCRLQNCRHFVSFAQCVKHYTLSLQIWERRLQEQAMFRVGPLPSYHRRRHGDQPAAGPGVVRSVADVARLLHLGVWGRPATPLTDSHRWVAWILIK